jgi:hypothetical protein
VLRDQGKYEAAEEMQWQVLELNKKMLGSEHSTTLTSMNNLAAVLRNQSKYEAAEEMQRRALKLREKVLGPEHPTTLLSMNNLAAVLGSFQVDPLGCGKRFSCSGEWYRLLLS